jgi:hypothetical protein
VRAIYALIQSSCRFTGWPAGHPCLPLPRGNPAACRM